MPRRKPYAPTLTEQIAVRTTPGVLFRYNGLHNTLSHVGKVRYHGKKVTKEAMINALVLEASRQDPATLLERLRPFLEEFEAMTRSEEEDIRCGLVPAVAGPAPADEAPPEHGPQGAAPRRDDREPGPAHAVASARRSRRAAGPGDDAPLLQGV